jgi:luciferase family oxidoreductase group 1
MAVALSVLDLAPVAVDTTATQALQDSITLARAADALGYRRYWLAEHHNMPSIAISAPEILIGIIARETTRIRVGSGGIMLPNHAPLRVAELFATLEALYPGRIDLGIGRAPGTDPTTALALRQSRERLQINDFPERLRELLAFGHGSLAGSDFPADHAFRAIHTIPTGVGLPPLWLLGSSPGYSAALAAAHGLGFAFAYHINPSLDDAVMALQTYHAQFVPTAVQPQPQAILAVNVICAETAAEATALAAVLDVAHVRRQRKEMGPLPTVTEAQAYQFSAVEQAQVERYRARQIVGTPSMVSAQIHRLVEATGVTEVAVATSIAAIELRLRSYQLLAETLFAD